MKRTANLLGVIFGVTMILLSLAITAETLLRKFFSHSMGGIDELSGYAIAICAPLVFAVALIEQSHIRINLLHMRLSKRMQGMLNTLAMVSMGLLAVYLFYFTVRTVQDTQAYKSIAQTQWATPLIYPQAIWLVSMGIFALIAVLISIQALTLFGRADWYQLNRRFGPSSAQEELDAELEDLKKREEMVR